MRVVPGTESASVGLVPEAVGFCRAAWTAAVSVVCVLLSAVFQTQTAHAYMLKTTKTGHRVRWTTPVVTLHVDPKLEAAYGADVVRASLTIATDAWRGLDNVPDVVVSEQPAPGYDANTRSNGVYLMRPWPFAREQLAVTVSTYDLDGRMIGVDVLVNGESDYALLPDGEDSPFTSHHDLAAVLTHEMGHVLGLDESPDDRESTMWPYIRGGDVHQRSLSEDDEAGIIAAYKDVLYETDLPLGCTQASVLGVIPSASNLRLGAWLILLLGVAQRLARRRAAALAAATVGSGGPRSKPSPSVRPAFHGNF